jgi:hypothetical protein
LAVVLAGHRTMLTTPTPPTPSNGVEDDGTNLNVQA